MKITTGGHSRVTTEVSLQEARDLRDKLIAAIEHIEEHGGPAWFADTAEHVDHHGNVKLVRYHYRIGD